MVVQMIETGLQWHCGVPGPSEFLSFDEHLYNCWFEEVESVADEIDEVLRELGLDGYGTNNLHVFALMSWITAWVVLRGTPSSNIVTTEAIVGQGQCRDALYEPAVPDAQVLPISRTKLLKYASVDRSIFEQLCS